MSVPVSIADLAAAIDNQIGWCYLLSTNDQGVPRVLAISPEWTVDGSALRAEIGTGTAANVAARPTIALLYPPASADGLSLIVDGSATVDASILTFTPDRAVMHRPAAGA